MIIGKNRKVVIQNIENSIVQQDFHRTVEIDDPSVTKNDKEWVISQYLNERKTKEHLFKCFIARKFADFYGMVIGADIEICGIENAKCLKSGAILTCNHFNPDDSVPARKLAKMLGKKRINIIVRESNFLMKGFVGFLMRHADTIPVSDNIRYLGGEFSKIIKELLEQGEIVMVYPEQEMWFNYRKPRPGKSGAYYYAAKYNVPVISCFVELQNGKHNKKSDFSKVKYKLHVLDTVYPDENLSKKENALRMQMTDERLKREAYERIYNKELKYNFEKSDIAGFIEY